MGEIEEAMMGRFGGLVGANLAHGRDPHALKPGANREISVQGELDEGAHFAGVGVVPDSGNHLKVGGLWEVQLLDEGANV
jgi:hypothetical protein